MRTPRPSGFSLLRALLATAVLSGIVALFAAPRLMPAQQRRALRAEAEKVAVVLADAREQALREQACVDVNIVPVDGRVTLLTGKSACDVPLSAQKQGNPPLQERALTVRGALSKRVRLAGDRQVVRFSPGLTATSLRPITALSDDEGDVDLGVVVSAGGALCVTVQDGADCFEDGA